MSEIQIGDRRGPRGPEGEKGERGPRGHRGHDGDTGPTGPTGLLPILAAAHTSPNGTFVAQRGFSGIVHTGPGLYDLTLANPPADQNNLVVEVTRIGSTPGSEAVVILVANDITVSIFDGANLPIDDGFFIVVYDLT